MNGHFVSKSAGGPCSICLQPSTHKIGEEIPWDEPCMQCGSTWQARDTVNPEQPNDCTATYHSFSGPQGQRHNLTAYVCCQHFTMLLGPATGCPVTVETATAHKKEWILLQPVLIDKDPAVTRVGYLGIECEENGHAKMPALVHYVEIERGDRPG